MLTRSLGEATELIEAWSGAHLAILVDAVLAEPAHPGRVHRLVVHESPTERTRAASSHGLDFGEAVELARVLGPAPRRAGAVRRRGGAGRTLHGPVPGGRRGGGPARRRDRGGTGRPQSVGGDLMCLAYPVQVIAVEPDQSAVVAWRGGWQRVTLLATADTVVVPGDWLLVQSGVALCRLDPGEAAERRRMLDQVQGGQS